MRRVVSRLGYCSFVHLVCASILCHVNFKTSTVAVARRRQCSIHSFFWAQTYGLRVALGMFWHICDHEWVCFGTFVTIKDECALVHSCMCWILIVSPACGYISFEVSYFSFSVSMFTVAAVHICTPLGNCPALFWLASVVDLGGTCNTNCVCICVEFLMCC